MSQEFQEEQKIIEGNPRRKRVRFKASPINSPEVHWFEAEYEEIKPGVWQKVYGTEKDLGPVE